MTAALASRLRRADPLARLIIEARVEAPGADIVQNAVSAHNWNSADSLAGLVVTPDQAVALSLGAPQVAAQTLGDTASLPLNTPFTSTQGGFWYVAGLSSWDPRYIGQRITSITAWLNPQNNGGQPNVVQTGQWKAQFFQAYINSQNQWAFAPKGDPVYVPGNTSGAAADITFVFPNGPIIPAPGQGGSGGNNFGPGPLVLMISAISNSGGLAVNTVWGADPAVDSTGIIYFPTWAASGATLSLACGAGDTTLFINGGGVLNALNLYGGYIKIDGETIRVVAQGVGPPVPTQLTVSRGANWTAAAAHAINSVVQTNLGGTRIQAYQITRQPNAFGGGLSFAAVPNPPRLTINVGQYAAATITFSANQFDLGAAQNPPTQPVQFTVRGDVPQGCTLQGQVLDDGGVTWRNISDGMYSDDPSLAGAVSRREHYKLRATLTPNAASTAAPILRALGVSVVANTDFSDVAELTGGRWAIDPITLKGEMGEFTLRAVRDGQRDYQDAITQLLATNNLTNILIRMWWGWYDNPTKLTASIATRAQWLHVDDFVIDDTNPLSASLELTLLSPLSLVKQALPRYDPVLRQRLPLTYPNATVPTATLDKVDADLIFNQLGSQLPSRFVGPRLPAATVPVPILTGGGIVSNTAANPSVITCANAHNKTGTFNVLISGSTDPAINNAFLATVLSPTTFSVPVAGAGGTGGTWSAAPGAATAIKVAKTIVSTDTNPAPGRPAVADDAKTELDALAFLAGFANISSQGRLKVVDCFGTQSVKVQFAIEELSPQSVLPGFRHRLPEFWVPWGWNGSGYPFLSYGLNAAALVALGQATIEPRPLDDTIAQWITAQTGDIAAVSSLADSLSTRMVNTFGPGLILWSFRSAYRYPELEPGDLIAVPTDWFVAHDPIAGRALRGLLYGIGIVQACDTTGREFSVWIRSYADIVGFSQGAPRLGFASPRVTSGIQYADPNGNVYATVNCTGAGSVRMAASTVAFPNAATVGAAGLLALDANGFVKSGTLINTPYGATIYVSVIAYENADGSGASSPLFEIQVSGVMNWMNNQGSVPPNTSDANPLSYSSWCIVAGTRGGLHWTWSAFTVYRADGSTVAIPASAALSTTPAPVLSQVAGGALAARTRCARIALVKDKTMLGISGESTLAVNANNLLKITSPAAVTGYDGWIPLIGDVNLNDECVQTATFPPSTPIAFGADWTEPAGGAIIPTGANTQFNDGSSVALAAHDWNLSASTTYFYYPCWDVFNGRLSFAGGGGMSAKSNLQAARQNRDGYFSLAAVGPISAAVPAIGGGGSGSGGGGCLHPDTVVDTPAGYRRLGRLTVGDYIRGRSGAWTRITKDERRPQREWIRVRVAGGESLVTTLTHPFTLFNGVKRAAELTLSDLVFVPGACAEIAGLERLTIEDVEQVDVECSPEREFWAGETDPTILTHNTYVQS